MKYLELVIFVGYFALCLGIALYFRRTAGRGGSDLLGSEQVNWFFCQRSGPFFNPGERRKFHGFSWPCVPFGMVTHHHVVRCKLHPGIHLLHAPGHRSFEKIQ